jgi:hypothetical protein
LSPGQSPPLVRTPIRFADMKLFLSQRELEGLAGRP